MPNLLVTPLARGDLADIWSYVAQDNVTAADRLLEQIDATFALVAQNPDVGLRMDDIKPGICCKPVKRNYLVFYEHRADAVRILRVLHAARRHEDVL